MVRASEALVFCVAILHGAVVAWVFLGGFLARGSRPLMSAQIFCAAWGLFTTVTPYRCPLTTIENALRSYSGLPTYPDDCITHYFWTPLALPTGPCVPYVILAVAVLINGVAYWPRGDREGASP